MPTPTITNGTEYFNTVTYTGNNTTPRSITGVGHQPDLIWIKDRVATNNHVLVDTSRGLSELLYSNSDVAAVTSATQVSSSDADGFTLGATTYVNESGSSNTYVAWNWKVNGGSTTTNDASSTGVGTIDSTYQVNSTAGFSIVTYTGIGGSGTFKHGLSSTPEWIVIKERSHSDHWNVWHGTFSATEAMLFNYPTGSGGGALITGSGKWNSAAHTSSVISVNGNNVNQSSRTYVAYVWTGVEGFSKFGKYEGNNSADGTFVYLGFKPAFVMIKGIDSSSSSYPWAIYDNRRSPTNPVSLFSEANSTAVDNTLDRIDFLSNGFKCRQAYSYSNAGETYIYMAWAEHPFVGDGTNPVTAR